MRVGLLGGSFDPIHRGHLMMARSAMRAARLDAVWLLVTPDPPHKQDRRLSPFADRLAMARLAAEGDPGIVVSDVENERPGPHYTVETVRLLRQAHPGWDAVFLIVGLDSALQLASWSRPRELLSLLDLIVIPRPGYRMDDLSALTRGDAPMLSPAALATIEANAAEAVPINLAATEIRDRIRQRLSIHDLVPEAVEHYIADHGLYSG